MRRKTTSKALAVLLAAVMVAGLLPLSALAARVARDDAPVTEAAMGDEVVKSAVKPAKAAEVAETEAETETGETEYDPATDSSRDYPLQLKRLTVNSHDNQGNKPSYMLDGDYDTQWVAGWGKGGEGPAAECAEDNWIQITLPQAVAVQGLRYQARHDGLDRGYASGGFGGWRLETSDDGVTWTNTVTGHWGVEGTPQNETGDVPFEGTYYKPESSKWYYAGWDKPVETRYIRLTATQLYAYEEKNINYGSCAELRLVVSAEQEIPQETEYQYECELVDGPVDGGVYAIFTNRASSLETELTMNSLLYYSGTGAVTNQVSAGAISEDADRKYLDLNHDRTFYPVETQLWQAIETEDGWLLKSLAGNRNKYLELSLTDGSAHDHAKVNREPQTLTVTNENVIRGKSYKILQQDGGKCCSLNWKGGYYTYNADNSFPLRFYEWKEMDLIKTDADVYTIDPIDDQTYTGEAIQPDVKVQKNGEDVTTGYKLNFSDNIEVGTAKVEVLVYGEVEAETTFQIVAKSDPGDNENPGGETENPGTEPENPGTEPENPGNEPENPGTEPENPGTEPENPDTEPENPGTEPENPGDNTGDDTPTTPTTPSKPATKPVTPSAEPEEDLDDPDVPLAELPMQFEDVTEDDWFYEGVKYNFNNNLMKGTSETGFEPYLDTTRGMIVTILHRVEGEPEAEPADFADVEDGMWYTEGVAWGQAEDIARGLEDGTNFGPELNVTREQMAAFLYRYAQYKGYDVTASGELDDFSDGGDTSDWAAESVRWAIGAGLIEGKGNHILDPKSTATRGEVALILMRFCENFMK